MSKEHPQAHILRAMADGKTIQQRTRIDYFEKDWYDTDTPAIGSSCYELRIKPDEPAKPREWWISPDSNIARSFEVKGFIHARQVIDRPMPTREWAYEILQQAAPHNTHVNPTHYAVDAILDAIAADRKGEV